MITLAQIRAARALLNWKQEDLARAAGLSLPSINNLERGLYSPRFETMQAIEAALERAGIEFLENNGVAMRGDSYGVQTFRGPRFIADLDDDILSVLHSQDSELLAISGDERQWIDYSGVTNHRYVEARAKVQWRERIVIPETADYIVSPPDSYRMLPPGMVPQGVIEIYGNRLALIEWEAMRVTIVKSTRIAQNQTILFNTLWDRGRPIPPERLETMERWRAGTRRKRKES